MKEDRFLIEEVAWVESEAIWSAFLFYSHFWGVLNFSSNYGILTDASVAFEDIWVFGLLLFTLKDDYWLGV
jgi:hypothetical protein